MKSFGDERNRLPLTSRRWIWTNRNVRINSLLISILTYCFQAGVSSEIWSSPYGPFKWIWNWYTIGNLTNSNKIIGWRYRWEAYHQIKLDDFIIKKTLADAYWGQFYKTSATSICLNFFNHYPIWSNIEIGIIIEFILILES